MSLRQVACTECGANVPPEFVNADEFLGCPGCGQLFRVFTFPALQRTMAGNAGLPAVETGEASCFYHAQKKAIVACDSCGRFLCALCDVEIGVSHRCPACLEAGKRTQKLETIEDRRTLYDGLALVLATVPLLLWPFTLFTAPAALFLVVRYWRRPLSVLPRTRIRFVLAFLIAFAQVCGWLFLFYFLATNRRNTA